MKYENNKIVYELGDWVTKIKSWGSPYDGTTTHRIKDIDCDLIYVDWAACQGANAPISHFRPATQDEINKATEEKKYKVGDWVRVDSSKSFFNDMWAERITQIDTVMGNNEYRLTYCPGTTPLFQGGWLTPATRSEIDKATEEKIMIGEYEVEFNGAFPPTGGAFSIKVGYVEVTKETFLKIKEKAGW